MSKKIYQKPAMQVFKLENRSPLLAGSAPTRPEWGGPLGYTSGQDESHLV
ncbi:MAG: hypothetical protein IJ868_10080 [Prevotella sp.]|nr:hypothetical protein [Prevotella sp.]